MQRRAVMETKARGGEQVVQGGIGRACDATQRYTLTL